MSSDKRRSTETEDADDGFTVVHKRKQRKLERTRPKFQFNTSYFSQGRKIGIAVSHPARLRSRGGELTCSTFVTCLFTLRLMGHKSLRGWWWRYVLPLLLLADV